jgi:hypothetical protein
VGTIGGEQPDAVTGAHTRMPQPLGSTGNGTFVVTERDSTLTLDQVFAIGPTRSFLQHRTE